MPTRKVIAGAIAGGLTVVLVWLVKTWGRVEIPAEAASAFTTILSLVTSYVVTEPVTDPNVS